MIIMTKRCVANKIHVSSSKVKVIDHTRTLFIGYNENMLYPAYYFVLHGGISQLYSKTSVAHKDHVAYLEVKSTFQTFALNLL